MEEDNIEPIHCTGYYCVENENDWPSLKEFTDRDCEECRNVNPKEIKWISCGELTEEQKEGEIRAYGHVRPPWWAIYHGQLMDMYNEAMRRQAEAGDGEKIVIYGKPVKIR